MMTYVTVKGLKNKKNIYQSYHI